MVFPLLGYLLGYYIHLLRPFEIGLAWRLGLLVVFLTLMMILSKRHTALIFIAFCVLGSLRWSVERRPLITEPKFIQGGSFILQPMETPRPTSYGSRMITNLWINADSCISLMLSVEGLFPDAVKYDAQWTAKGLHIKPLNLNAQPHQFSYPKWLVSQGVQATASLHVNDLITWEQHQASVLVHWKEWRRQWSLSLRNSLSNYSYAQQLLPALLLGDRTVVSKEVKQSFADAGVVHVLAVSGMHLGLIYAVWNWILGLLVIRPVFKKALLLIGIWSFALVAGLPISVIRAALMLSITILAGKRSAFYPLQISVVLMLFAVPSWLMEVGFQLSVLAVGGILLAQQNTKQVSNKWRYGSSALRVSLAAQWTTLPVIIGVFGRFPIFFLLANLLLLPLVTVLLYGAMAWMIINLITPWGNVLLEGVDVLAQIIVKSSSWIANLRHAVWEVGALSTETLGLWLMAWVLMSYALWGVRRWRALAVFSACSLLALGIVYQQTTTLLFWHSSEEKTWISMVNSQGWKVYSSPRSKEARGFYTRLPTEQQSGFHQASLHESEAGLILQDPEEKFLGLKQDVHWYAGSEGASAYLLTPFGDSIPASNSFIQWKLRLLEAEK